MDLFAVRTVACGEHSARTGRELLPDLQPIVEAFATRLLRDKMRCRVILLLVDDLRAGLRGLGVTVNGRGSLRAALA